MTPNLRRFVLAGLAAALLAKEEHDAASCRDYCCPRCNTATTTTEEEEKTYLPAKPGESRQVRRARERAEKKRQWDVV